MKTLCKVVRERRMVLGLTQRELATRVKFEDGHSISATYLCLMEHDVYTPRVHIITQFGRVLGMNPDVLFYLAGRVPPDVCELDATNEQLEAAFEAFRRVLRDGCRKVSHKPVRDLIPRGDSVDSAS
jgi:transcriptional regulator with XRE-family HTH domain